MNKETKEILDELKNEDRYIEDYGYQYKRISLKDTKLLLDYITNLQHTIKDNEDTLIDKNECIDLLETQLTNLQEENESLRENNQNMQEEMARSWEKCDNYKSRCDKVIEILHNITEDLPLDLILIEIEHSEYILQNGSDSE